MRHPRPAALLPALLASLMLLLAGPVGAWGPQGHRLVAALAWADLTPQAQAEVAILLAGEADPTLPGIANWADQLRAEDPDLGKRSAPWPPPSTRPASDAVPAGRLSGPIRAA